MERIQSKLFLLKDIRFWIAVLFILRLFGITNPPLESGHNWRQSLTNMVARNFLEVEASIFYPRIDMAGDLTGIMGSEFPFFNYLIYLVSLCFGYEHWYGRLINLVVSSAGVYAFYRLLKSLFNWQLAFQASIIFLTSIWFAFARKVMPDTFSVSLVIIGLYFGKSYLQSGHQTKLLLYFVSITLGMLCKIPALSLISVVAVLILVNSVSWVMKIRMFAVTALSVLIVGAWYFLWVPHLLDTFHYQLYFPKGFMEGWLEIKPLWNKLMAKFYFEALYAYSALPFLVWGIYALIQSNNRLLQYAILVISITFGAFILKTGAVFPLHNYYVIPFVPVLAFLVALGLNKIQANFRTAVLVVIALEGIANQQHDFFIPSNQEYKLSLEALITTHCEPNKLIVINGGQSPQLMYFAHRKGWSLRNDELNQERLQSLKNRGATYLVIDKHLADSPSVNYKRLVSNLDFDIYELN